MRTLPADIEWLSASEGGRQHPPIGPSYRAPVRFGPWSGSQPEEATFTFIVELVDSSDAYHWRANVTFEVAGAPEEVFVPGATFELYEGRRCVARGRVFGAN